MQESEVIVENTVLKSRSKVLEEPQKCLGLVVGNVTVYLSLNPKTTLLDISVTSSTVYLPLYLPSFIALQDLLLEYGKEAIDAVLLLRTSKREKTPTHAYHYSSSSIGHFMGTSSVMMGYNAARPGEHSRTPQRQNFLQKGATRVKKMANTVKNATNSVGGGASQKKKKKAEQAGTQKAKSWKVSLGIDRFQFRIQISKGLFLSYSLQSLAASVMNDNTILVLLQKHGVDFVRMNSPYQDLLFRCTNLPEITVIMKEVDIVPLPSTSSGNVTATATGTATGTGTSAGNGNSKVGEQENSKRDRLPSYSTINSVVGGTGSESVDGMTIRRMTEEKVAHGGKSGGMKKMTSLQVIVEKIEFSLTTRQVNQFRILSVGRVNVE